MLELPEALTIAFQLSKSVVGKEITHVLPPTKEHKFCWFSADPAEYDTRLSGHCVLGAQGFGIFAEIAFSGNQSICFNDGVNVRLTTVSQLPKNYQLAIEFADGDALVFTVAMYGSIILHSGEYDNDYYIKSRSFISPLSSDFSQYFRQVLDECKPTLSAKALLATEQRFPGLGNGVLQDILFAARLHPKRKLTTLSAQDRVDLLGHVVATLREMTDHGGRDTEKDLFGKPGGYRTRMSKITLPSGCPVCGTEITKETYLGGSVYFCPHCQPLDY